MSMNDEERLVLNGKWDPQTVCEHIHRYHFAKQLVNNKVVLDAACGSGYGSALLAEEAKEVYGIDISEEAIEYARSNYEKVKYSAMSIATLDFPDNFFDVIF